jgi:hypothetical protein
MNPPDIETGIVEVYLDGVLTALEGSHNGFLQVDSDRLYALVSLPESNGFHDLRLVFKTPGTKVFAFTFG